MNVRFGIIGCGNISAKFADAVLQSENCILEAVAASDESRAWAFAEKFGSKKSYGSYEKLIADNDIDIIYIGLTNNLHFEITKKCLENGKNVICEKPLTLEYEQTVALVELAKEKDVLLMEAMWMRCLPAYLKAKSWANSKIGKIKIIQADFCINVPFDENNRVYNKASGGGALYDVGIYPIDFVTGILGETPDEISGMAHVGSTGVDEYNVLTMKFGGGEIAVMTSGVSVALPKEARIFGDKGRILIPNFYGARECFLYDKDGQLVEEFFDEIENGFVHEVNHVAELFLNGKKESNLIPFDDIIFSAEMFSAFMSEWGIK